MKEYQNIETFLLSHDSASQAFINLSNTKEHFGKEELLEETKRLIRKEIIEQVREKNDIKTNLISICAKCKKIRNIKGDWEDMENSIPELSEIEFTHTVCPKCQHELYPDYKIRN